MGHVLLRSVRMLGRCTFQGSKADFPTTYGAIDRGAELLAYNGGDADYRP
jgi:hypothetical protein